MELMKGVRIMLKKIAAAAGLLAASLAPASAYQDKIPCNPAAGSTIEMAACAGESFQKADRQMNVVYAKLLTKAQMMDKDSITGTSDKAVDRLRKAQRAWVTWRDAECPMQSIPHKGGTIERILWPACAAELTEERTKALQGVLTVLEKL
jgi:uncharacterized protein YecT (DUF1311 family)